MYELTKAQWKLLQDKIAIWQERYMERLLQEYASMIANSQMPSKTFWELEKRIKADKKHPGVVVELEKSEAIPLLRIYLRDGIIDLDDLAEFGEELGNIVKAGL